MALFHRVYRVLDKGADSWTEWTSINPYARDTAESQPHDRPVEMGDDNSEVFQSMIAGGWHTMGNEFREFTIKLVKTHEIDALGVARAW